ncbi:alpha/beta fold hydrolase [Marmoricola sp. URHB0036]|uniref:alpha/beta fold hydrolase n=1 Tax=Marmoricola sp. URHB0036 TaxID=1298863 RepID=UPI00042A2239|nr:alpha/beta hydrolase [Marmoricola sp. URHB0036]
METWSVNGIELSVLAEGSGPLVVLAHGFPDLALTWRLQVPALVAAGYRVVAPDMRGYGGSARPEPVEAYRSDVVGEDLVGLLDHEGVERAHFVGHDWGASSLWPLGLTHPDRVLSLTGLSVPYTPPSPAPPTEIFRKRLGEDFYMLRFHSDDAIPELERDPARTVALILNGRLDDPGPDVAVDRPTWLPQDVFDEYVAAFRRTGFAAALNYYRNLDPNWRLAEQRGAGVIEAPSLFVTGSRDPVALFMSAENAASSFRALEQVVVEGAGHWVHQQEPDQVNGLLLGHLSRSA